jgi:hypothetical protein
MAFKGGLTAFDQQAREQFSTAQKAAAGVSWLIGLARIQEVEKTRPPRDEALARQVENLERYLESVGTAHDRKFEEEQKLVADNIVENEHTRFESAQVRLGTMLGFQCGKVESTGSPDPWWVLSDDLCLVFEDHSEAKETSSLDVSKARQVSSHPNWIRENVPGAGKGNIFPVLVTAVKTADTDALPHLKDVYLWNLEDFRVWAKAALVVIRDLRRCFPGSGDLAWRANAAEKLQSARLDPGSIAGMLVSQPAVTVLASK